MYVTFPLEKAEQVTLSLPFVAAFQIQSKGGATYSHLNTCPFSY